MNAQLIAKSSPILNVREIQDVYVQKNFRNLQDYFASQNQLRDFNFLEIIITGATTNQKIAHGLNSMPQDVILTRATGPGTVTLNWGNFDDTSIDITATDACRIRIFVGSYWNNIPGFTATPGTQILNPSGNTVTNLTSVANITDLTVVNNINAGTTVPNSVQANLGLSALIHSNAITLSLTQADGITAPTTTSPAFVVFRDATGLVGSQTLAKITSSLSITIASTKTLGHVSGKNQYIWVYLVNPSGGTFDLAVSGVNVFDDSSLQTTTATPASSGTVLYSNLAYTSVPIKLIGRFLVNETAAGTWATAPTRVDVFPIPQVTTTEWVAYTPTYNGLGSCTAVSMFSKRVGSELWVMGSFTAGTVGVSTATMSIGYNGSDSNVTVNTTVVPSSPNKPTGGWATPTANSGGPLLMAGGNTTVSFGSWAQGSQSSQTSNNMTTNGQTVAVSPSPIPITGWSLYGPS